MFKIIEAPPAEDEWVDLKAWGGRVVRRVPIANERSEHIGKQKETEKEELREQD